LLFYLPEVVLQDYVALRRQFPQSAEWNHPVFQQEDCAPFAAKVAEVIDAGEEPSQFSVLTRVLPDLAEYLNGAEADPRQDRTRLVARVDRRSPRPAIYHDLRSQS
jgi:hypothetical protein